MQKILNKDNYIFLFRTLDFFDQEFHAWLSIDWPAMGKGPFSKEKALAFSSRFSGISS